VDSGQWTVDSGQWTVDSGQWTVDSGQWTVDSGQWTAAVDSGSGQRLRRGGLILGGFGLEGVAGTVAGEGETVKDIDDTHHDAVGFPACIAGDGSVAGVALPLRAFVFRDALIDRIISISQLWQSSRPVPPLTG
jgi:hypothetical protein